MERPLARLIITLAVAVGLAADLLLDGHAPGLNVPLLVAAVLAAGWAVRRPGRAPDPLDAWLPVGALVSAGFVAIRADPFLAALDLLGAVAFVGASIAAFSGLAVTRRSASIVLAMGTWVAGASAVGAIAVVRDARPTRDPAVPRRAPTWAAPVLRGLAIVIPLALIFAVLFASADPIFRRGLADVLGWRIDLGDLPGRLVFSASVAWLTAGLLLVAARGLPPFEMASLGAAARTASVPGVGRRFLGTTEAVVVLLGIDAIVGLFVALQVGYLFGGLDTLAAAGLTYSDYARRGFFELVAAAALAGGLLVGLEIAITRRSRAYLGLAVALVVLTLAVLASAALRLHLYQDAYGWTELRLYVAVAIAALAGTLAVLAAALLMDRTRWLGHAMAVIGLVSLVGLNLLAPAAFVAERNLERVIDPTLVPPGGWSGLDTAYLDDLPDDAVPAFVAALPRLPDAEARAIRVILTGRAAILRTDPTLGGVPSWNLGRERARAALASGR